VTRFRLPVLVLAAFALVPLLAGCDPARSTISRPDDPVVLTGSGLTRLVGKAPNRIVAFRVTPEKTWQQVPVQVDERAVVDFGAYPTSNTTPGTVGTVYGGAPIGRTALQYTDPNTFTGPDTNTAFDADDELVFMASDLGGLAPQGHPTGVVAGSAVEVTVEDPIDEEDLGWLYLYETTGSLQPGAGRSYVTYTFGLTTPGAYRSVYKRAAGPNPENSTVTTARYSHHFSDRWQDDSLVVRAGNATQVDLLDRHKSRLLPGNCGRSEDTFNAGEGAFVVNKSGPVRAIRSYVGANSGPLTQRTHLFYAGRHDVLTDLRVHAIPGVLDYFDYSPAASGMRYANNRNRSGVVVDGQPDAVTAGKPDWELLAGAQGSIIHTHRLQTNLSLQVTNHYLDDSTPAEAQCTGDDTAYGASGPWVSGAIADTDPRSGTSNTLRSVRSLTYRPPGATVADADRTFAEAAFGLSASAKNRS
jgi:hypothetical protein